MVGLGRWVWLVFNFDGRDVRHLGESGIDDEVKDEV